MDKLNKPFVPHLIFIDDVLYSTIIDYHWIEHGDPILKAGWFPIQKFNHEHPIIVNEVKKSHQAQFEILERMKIDWEHLENTYMAI